MYDKFKIKVNFYMQKSVNRSAVRNAMRGVCIILN